MAYLDQVNNNEAERVTTNQTTSNTPVNTEKDPLQEYIKNNYNTSDKVSNENVGAETLNKNVEKAKKAKADVLRRMERKPSFGLDTPQVKQTQTNTDINNQTSGNNIQSTEQQTGYKTLDSSDNIQQTVVTEKNEIEQMDNKEIDKLSRQHLAERFSKRFSKQCDPAGNGKFDAPATQMAGNCWMHGTINAMTASEEGTSIVDSLVDKKDSTISAKFPANTGINPYNETIYNYTENQINELQKTISKGDGDYTAYVDAAVTHATKNKGYHQQGTKGLLTQDTGSNLQLGFELISGQNAYQDLPYDPCLETGKLGVFYGDRIDTRYEYGETDSNLFHNSAREMIDSGSGAMQIGFQDNIQFNQELKNKTKLVDPVTGNVVEGEAYIHDHHAYAVKMLDENYIYLQESNHPGTFIQMPIDDYIYNTKKYAYYRWK